MVDWLMLKLQQLREMRDQNDLICIVIMSNLTQGHFDFAGIGRQAAYLSCFTPDSVEDYWLPAAIPAESKYHLVGCHNLAVMARCNYEPILLGYIKASEGRCETIIDLCLPFFDQQLRRTFLGRYIILGGKLLGIRFSTTAVHPAFSAWPRHRAKQITVRLLGKQYNVLVGEIALYLINLRIGLLFQSEIEKSTQEYINCGFDLIALTYECKCHTTTAIALKNDLSKQIMFLQAEIGLPERRVSEDSIRTMIFGEGTYSAASRIIYMGYYDFTKHFSGKRQLYLSQKERNFITPLEVNASFSQNQGKVEFKSPNYELNLGNFTNVNMPNIKIDLTQYLRRIYLYFYRAGYQRIIVMVQDTPVSICFLYIVQEIIKRQEKGFSIFSKRFDFANICSSRLSSLEGRFPLLKFQLDADQKIASCDQTLQRVSFFNFVAKRQARQSYFPVVTADPLTANVLRMLNSQEQIMLEQGDCNASKSFSENSSCECLTIKEGRLTTWITTEFFTFQELRQLYLSPELQHFIDDEEYHIQLWEKYSKQNSNKAPETDKSLEKVEAACLNEPHMLEEMLRKESLFTHEFQEHYNRVKEACYQGSKEKIYSHFLFRKLTKIEEHCPRLEFLNQIMSELLFTPEASIMKVFKFISSRNSSFFSRLSSRLTLDAIAYARQEIQRKITCHRCEISYFPQLMYTCRTKICKQSFCYECLLRYQSQQEKALLIEDIEHLTMLKLCPICKGSCVNCQTCEVKRAKLIEQKQKCVCPIKTQCHYCKRSTALFQFTCSREDCKKTYCLRCIEEGFRSRNNDYMNSNWLCFACENRCYCNQCEREKSKLMSLKVQTSEGKAVEKEKNIKTANPLKLAGLSDPKHKKNEAVIKEQVTPKKKTNEQIPAHSQKASQSESNKSKTEKGKAEKINLRAKFSEKRAEDGKNPLQNSNPSLRQEKLKEKSEETFAKIDPLQKWRKLWEKSIKGDEKQK